MTRTALILENSSPHQNSLCQLVKGSSLFENILFAQSPAEALERLCIHKVDMVVSDWRQGNLETHEEFLGETSKREAWADIPVVFFTSEKCPELRTAALDSGADDCCDYKMPAPEIVARMRLHLRRQERALRLRQDKEQLARMAVTDTLTGVYNRGYFDASLESELARNQRTGQPLALLLIDLDHFKSINDSFGHSCGDSVLKAVAATLKKATRTADVVCRYGGEEFAVILPETPLPQAYRVAERIRRQIAELTAHLDRPGLKVSASIGISSAAGAEAPHAKKLIDRADCALYSCKRNGRNRTEIFRAPAPKKSPAPFPLRLGSAVGFA